MVEYLPDKCKTLNSNPSTWEGKKGRILHCINEGGGILARFPRLKENDSKGDSTPSMWVGPPLGPPAYQLVC